MWAVIDVETTGLYWKSVDRIVEIAVVRLDRHGHQVDAWSTLLEPDRDLGPTHIHGITASDVRGAPTFDLIADDLLWRLSGHVPVGHNVRFDLAFLTNELGRVGLDFSGVQGICTMALAGMAGLGRSLPDCCASLGVPLAEHHSALADAEATGRLFEQLLGAGNLADLAPLPSWPQPAGPAPVRRRTGHHAPRVSPGLARLASRVGVPDGAGADHGAAVSYLDMLDRVLEDRAIDPEEAEMLAEVARAWGISEQDADKLHRAYITETWKLAEADGIVTKAEIRDIGILAELLGVPPSKDASVQGLARDRRSIVGSFDGMTVCFTGTTLAHVDGMRLERGDLEAYAEEAGMVVKDNVSGRLDLLVVADPDTRSGKAKKAVELGVRKVYDVAFLRALGVDCDAGGDSGE